MSADQTLTCNELIDFLSDYLDEVLAPGVRLRFDAHLASCPDCVDYLESYRETARLAAAAAAGGDGEVPEDVPEELVRAVLAARRS